MLELCDRCSNPSLPLEQETLARIIGVGRTNLAAAACELKRIGLIQYTRTNIRVVDREALEAYSCACRRELRQAQLRAMPEVARLSAFRAHPAAHA